MAHFDLAILGSGSANSIVDQRFGHLRVALLDDLKVHFGGTCLNVGCIPTKMFVHTADLAAGPAHAAGFGLEQQTTAVHWPQIRDRVFGRIDPISESGLRYRAEGTANLTFFPGQAAFTGPGALAVGDEQITADRIVIATGSRPILPDLPGLAETGYLTNEDAMRLDELPQRLIILGSGFIASEFAHVFSSLGTKVTVVARSGGLLRAQDEEVSAFFTGLAAEKWDVRLNRRAALAERTPEGVRLHLDGPDGVETVDADHLLVAVGRRPNGDLLNLPAAGVRVHPDGRIVVDEFQRTTAPGVWALGDVSSEYQLKHVANHEARIVQHNLLNPDQLQAADHRFVPHAVFTSPQIASVGLTEQRARADGVTFVTGRCQYGSIAYGWAMNEPAGFAKILAEPGTGRLLGAHIIGPQAPTLIQPLIQAITFGLDARTMARGQYWIHPAMPELLENALLDLPLD
ncbi:MAG TPA: mycothione reductase [Actinocrinis sp.]|nr:mycothione reductase [Actinocrinis sp.]